MDATDALGFKSKAELAYEWLRERILAGELPSGERISVDALAPRLGISKIPIREALQRLESQGLVVQTKNVGAVVAELSMHEVQGVFLARRALESLVAELAAPRAKPADIEALRAIQGEMRAALRERAFLRMSELNTRFHLAIAGIAGYRVLADLCEQLLLSVRRYRVAAPLDAANWRRVVHEHDVIVAALARGDAPAAGDAAARHAASQAEHEAQSAADAGGTWTRASPTAQS